jgi:mono/diheme cytochrome c family protein
VSGRAYITYIASIAILLSGCAMSEEVRRIEGVKQAEQLREASHTTDLTGEQIFIRSCNSCHPNGKAGIGPSLDKLEEHFGDDNALKKFIRAGKGNMPAQSKSVLNDKELDSLVKYLRKMQL